MIIILKKEAAESQVNGLISLLESKNIQPHVSRGSLQTIVGCVGDVSRLDRRGVRKAQERDVRRIQRVAPRGDVLTELLGKRDELDVAPRLKALAYPESGRAGAPVDENPLCRIIAHAAYYTISALVEKAKSAISSGR